MFETKHPALRIGAYIIIGFFTLIIIISFGMPDFMSRIGMDESVVAIVNGEKIYRLDFLRYRDSMARQLPNTDKKEMQDMILSNLIMRRLMLQFAYKTGIEISDSKVSDSIKTVFRDQDGKFSKDYMDRYLVHYHQTFTDFFLMIKEDLMINQLRQMISIGVGVSPDEVKTDYAISGSKIQIRYCYVPITDLDKRFKGKINVTEKEIDEELQKSKNEIKDPKTDRKRIKEKLEKRKYADLKNELINAVNKLAEENKSFDQAASCLAGKTYLSNIFKIGDPVKEGSDKGKALYSIGNSPVFSESFLSLEKGRTSRVIDSYDGLYIFTPVKRDLAFKEPPAKEYSKIENELLYQKNNAVFMSVMTSVHAKAKIIRNLKID